MSGAQALTTEETAKTFGSLLAQSSRETLLHRHKNLGGGEMFSIFSATGQTETLPQHLHHGRTTPKGAVVLLEFTLFRFREKERCTCQYLHFEL